MLADPTGNFEAGMALWNCPQLRQGGQAFTPHRPFTGYKNVLEKKCNHGRWHSSTKGNSQKQTEVRGNNCQHFHQLGEWVLSPEGRIWTANYDLLHCTLCLPARYQLYPYPVFLPIELLSSNMVYILFIYFVYSMSPCLYWIPQKEHEAEAYVLS